MKNLKLFGIILSNLFLFSLFAVDVTGNQSGEWIPENNPYNVVGDITVPINEILQITGGVEIVVQGNFQITVAGKLIAAGTETDSIFIHSVDAGINWSGIKLENEIEENSFQYCHIENAENAVKSVNSAVNIDDCRFTDNEKAIDIFGSGNPQPIQIQNCFISACQQNGIYILENSNVQISNCEITHCALDESPRGAIMLSSQGGECNPLIRGNNIHHNVWQGISAWDITGGAHINPQIEQNEISYNLTGIYLYFASGVVDSNYIHHNFVSGNPNSGAGIMIGGASSAPIFTHNEITGNFTGFFITENAIPNLGDLSNYCSDDDGENHIYENIDETGHTWSVYNMSAQNIKAENNLWDSNDSAEISQTIYDGNNNPAFGLVDFEPIFPQIHTAENLIENRIRLSNYPNPFRTSTTISFEFSNEQNRQNERNTISIYNIKGQKIRTLECINQVDAKEKESKATESLFYTTWNGKDDFGKPVNSGIYYYRLSNSQNAIGKMILIK